MTLLQFLKHIAGATVRIEEATHHALEHVAERIEAEAKREIGTYQSAAPPFVGWAELADSTKDDRVHQGFSENDPGLRTGAMGASIDHRVGHQEAVVGSDDDHLVYFELGTMHQPPRSVLGIAAVKEAPVAATTIGYGAVVGLVGMGRHLLPII